MRRAARWLQAAWIYAGAYVQFARGRIDEYGFTERADRARAITGRPLTGEGRDDLP